jgi:murein DD-endopeptidase MepM/ murein hydrolase activator NlpD
MMYTARYAHLAAPVAATEFERGDLVGFMGSTGQSTGPHLHLDVVTGVRAWVYRMHDIDRGNPHPDFRQLALFVDEELTGGPFRITTYPYDPRYKIGGAWKAHPGVDIVSVSGQLYWNRSSPGRVITAGYDRGYGHYVNIAFTA